MSNTAEQSTPQNEAPLVELKLQVPEDLFRAFQRCLWMQLSETGNSRLDLTKEMLRDFLIKHGC